MLFTKHEARGSRMKIGGTAVFDGGDGGADIRWEERRRGKDEDIESPPARLLPGPGSST